MGNYFYQIRPLIIFFAPDSIKSEENCVCFSVTVCSRVQDDHHDEADGAAPRFNNYDEMMYHDYESQDTGDWSNYSPVSDIYTGDADTGLGGQVTPGLNSGPAYQQRPQQKFGYNALHDNPPSGNPFDDPFFQNFLKGYYL